MEELNLEKEKQSLYEDLNESISNFIKKLAEKFLFPSLNNKRLIDVLNEENIVDFIKNNSILSNPKDIKMILESKYNVEKGLEIKEKEILDIYEIIFGEKKIKKGKRQITIFSGGTGSNSLTKGLLEISADLTLLLNAYDDGKSTGDIRKNFNLLGPSDIAKNIIALMGDSEEELRKFLGYRLSTVETPEKLRDDLKAAIAIDGKSNPISNLLNKVESDIKIQLKVFLNEFNKMVLDWEAKNNRTYDLRDYGIRNMIYVGAHLYYKKDYHYTNNKLIELFGLSGKIILNNQQSLWLIAVTENGNLFNCESAVVHDYLDKEIIEIFLVKRVLNDEEIKQFYSFTSIEDKINYINVNFAIYPQATKEAIEAITQTELIIFAPTTFHSSLTPTLITEGISKALNKSNALKISVANLIRERGYHTVGENLVEMEKYLNHGINERPFTEIDYLIINTHGNRTDGVVNANRLPIDKKLIFQYGVELVEVKVEDVNEGNKHQHKLITQIINSLKSIDDLGYRINKGKLVRREEINIIENKREQLRKLLSNPFLYKIKANRVKRLVTEILGIDKIEDFKPIRPIKVVILGAGKSTRLKSDIPKVIYPINGKANLAYLLDRYSMIDDTPMVVVNSHDKSKIKEWLKSNPKYNAQLIVTQEIRGTAMSLWDILKQELNDFEGDIFLSWGDITNISLETIQLTSALHQAMGNSIMTVPTAWEKNPYAGLIRDDEGKVKDVFITRESSEQKREFGEHDSSIFIFKSKEVREALTQLVNSSGIEKEEIDELNFLKIIPLLASNDKEIVGISNVDFRECMGFNTQEEAKLIERYMGELKEIKLPKENMIDIVEEEIVKEHSTRLEEYLNKTYRGIILDVDETITNEEDGNIPEDIIKILIELASKGIPIGIVTGRTNDSLTSKFISKIIFHQNFSNSSKDKIYIYPENGAYCYRLDQGFNTKMYEKKIPYYVLETAVKFLRKNILGFKDDYAVRDHKLHIFPQNSTDQKQYVSKINAMFKKMNIPLVAYRSNSIETSGSILVSMIGGDKGTALSHFAEINNISIDEVVKVGDMADIDSVDHALLKGMGSFSISEIDIYDKDQVGIPVVKGPSYKGVNGSRWLFSNLKFSIKTF